MSRVRGLNIYGLRVFSVTLQHRSKISPTPVLVLVLALDLTHETHSMAQTAGLRRISDIDIGHRKQ